jgi:hypothetical protein
VRERCEATIGRERREREKERERERESERERERQRDRRDRTNLLPALQVFLVEMKLKVYRPL